MGCNWIVAPIVILLLFPTHLFANNVADNEPSTGLFNQIYGHIGYSQSFDDNNDSSNGGINNLKDIEDGGWGVNLGAVFNSDFSPYVLPYVEATYLDHDDRYLSILNGGFRYDWQWEDSAFTPYASLGVGYLTFRWAEHPVDNFSNDQKAGRSPVVTTQGGILWSMTEHWGLDFRARFDMYDITTTIVENSRVTQIEDKSSLSLLVGLSYIFGENPPDGDDDRDGVLNSIDQCPNTLPNIPVNEVGCPRRYFSFDLSFEFAKFKLANLLNQPEFQVVKFLQKHPQYHVYITGHTDSKGKASFNQALSEKRAAQAKQFLVDNQIEAERVTTYGRGESLPIADNKTEEGRLKNRRITVEFFIPEQDQEEQ